MIFTFTRALWVGLALIAVLTAIYMLRIRSKPRMVSSLMLWIERKHHIESGRVLQKPQIPISLILEITILALLTTAAAGPRITRNRVIPLAVILDDSFSMRADEPNSPRTLAIKTIEAKMDAEPDTLIQLVIAGKRSEFLGEMCHNKSQLRALWPLWKCASPIGNLEQAIALVRETRKYNMHILVATDRSPCIPSIGNNLEWLAFGRPLANTAIINGGRTDLGNAGRFFVEIANLSSQTRRITGQIENPTKRNFQCEIKAFETQLKVFDTESTTAPIVVRLPPDNLSIDNEMVLAPTQQRHVKAAVQLNDNLLQNLSEKALTSSEMVTITTASSAELLICSKPDIAATPWRWVLEFVDSTNAKSFAGPFAIDHASPLAEGLTLNGVIWGTPISEKLCGTPILLVLDYPLLTDERMPHEAHHFRMRYAPQISNFHNTPNWPILFWNLVKWRQSRLPGPLQSNLRLGMEATIHVTPDNNDLCISAPNGEKLRLQAEGDSVVFHPEQPGLYRIENGEAISLFAVNCMAKDESDLSNNITGRWGNFNETEEVRRESFSLAWLFLLPALLLLGLHLFCISGIAK